MPESAIKEIAEKAAAIEEFIPKEERKAITRSLRGANYLADKDTNEYLVKFLEERLRQSIDDDEKAKIDNALKGLERVEETEPSHVKEAMITTNRVEYSSVVASIMDNCIFGANKMPYASLPTEGVDPNPNTGKERTAKNNLKLLSDFLLEVEEIKSLIKSSDPEKHKKGQEKIKELKQDKDLLKKLNDNWGINSGTANDLIEGKKNIDDIFESVQDQISQHIDELFYYPRLSKTYEYNIDGKTQKWAIDETEWQKVVDSKKYNKGTTPRSNDHEILGQLVGRHMVLAFNCFKGLGTFSDGNQENITNDFLQNSVLKNNRWKDEKVSTIAVRRGKKQTDVKISDKYLQDKIDLYVILDYQNRVFYTKDSTIEQQRNASQNQGQTISS